jgi:hypothetical protein
MFPSTHGAFDSPRLKWLDLKDTMFVEDVVAFERGPDGRGGFMVVVLTDGTHFVIRYFVDFAFVAADFVSFNEFFLAMVAEIQMTEIVFGQPGNEDGCNEKWISSVFGSGSGRHNVWRFT